MIARRLDRIGYAACAAGAAGRNPMQQCIWNGPFRAI